MKRGLRIKRWIVIGLGILLVIVAGIFIYIYSIYHTFKTIYTEEMFEPLISDHEMLATSANEPLPKLSNTYVSTYRSQPVSVKKKDPISVLILGIDETAGDIGRSDTILLMILNPEQRKSLLFNIPRDTRTEIAKRGTMDKINHAYAFGGVQMSVQTVENFLEIPIDYYIKLNMEGFIEIIDTLGGVDVENPFSFTTGYDFPKGNLHLDGEQALSFVRMRYGDTRGDLGRNERQRGVLKAVIEKGTSPTVMTKLDQILKQVGKHVKSNILFDEIDNLILDYRAAIAEVDEIEIEGRAQMIDHIYYYMVSNEERERISSLVRDYLTVPEEPAQAAFHNQD